MNSSLAARQECLARLQARQQEIQAEIHAAMVGQRVPVLVEGTARSGEGVLLGRTLGNHLVHFSGHNGMVGRILPIELTSCTATAVYGTVATQFHSP